MILLHRYIAFDNAHTFFNGVNMEFDIVNTEFDIAQQESGNARVAFVGSNGLSVSLRVPSDFSHALAAGVEAGLFF